MPTITAPGAGSGLDINSIISQLVALERRPLDALDNEESSLNAQLSDFGRLKSAMSTFQSTMADLSSLDKFKVFTATSSNGNVFTGVADGGAAGGSYPVNVTQLAQNSKLHSVAFTDSNAVVGTGSLDITVGTDTFSVTIDGTNSTLAGIRTAINEASDNTGVTASIITATDGSYLVLTSDETGTANAVTVAVTGDGDGNDTDNLGLSQMISANLSTIQTAQDATLTIDGFPITSSTNSVSGAVEGLTFDLTGIGSGTLSLSRDDETITASVQSFVDAYNEMKDLVKELRAGRLASDNTLLTIDRLTRDLFNTPANIAGGAFSYLIEVGISTGDDDRLELDATALTTALDTDFGGVAKLFTNNDQGFAFRTEALLGDLLTADGLLEAHEDGINNRIDSLGDRRSILEVRLELIEQRLVRQFTALDTLIASLNSTSAFLTQQLASLATIGRPSN